MKVYFRTGMEELPKTCAECKCEWCRLPCKANSYEPILKVKYTKQRHEECPLKTEEDL